MQTRALFPHVLPSVIGSVKCRRDAEKQQGEPSRVGMDEALSEVLGGYSPAETRIRDTYDAFLDGLERFGSYLQSNLVTPAQLRPYLTYWISELVSTPSDPDECAWKCVLLTYIEFYSFCGVQALFAAFGTDISSRGALYRSVYDGMTDRELADALMGSLNWPYSRS